MTIKDLILEHERGFYSDKARFEAGATNSDQFEYAFEGLLRSIPGIDGVDGFEVLIVAEESAKSLRAVGLTNFLPDKLLPLDALFWLSDGNLSYRIIVGTDDNAWNGLAKSKRWNAVYLYGKGQGDPRWNWRSPVEGSFSQDHAV